MIYKYHYNVKRKRYYFIIFFNFYRVKIGNKNSLKMPINTDYYDVFW